MLKHLGVDQYGLYVICISLIGFMNFVDLGVGQAVVKFVAGYEATGEREKVNPVLAIALLMYIVLGVVTVLLLYLASPALAGFLYDSADKAEIAQTALRITSLALLLSYINQFFFNVAKAYHRFDIPALIHNSGNIGGIVLSSILLVMGYSLHDVLWGYVVVQTIALSCGFFFSRGILPEGVRFGLAFDAFMFGKMISFSAYTFIGNFTIALVNRADKLLIGSIIGTEAVTYYQIPFTIAQMANGITNTLVQILFPRFSELSATSAHDELLKLYRSATHVLFFLSVVIAVMLITVGGPFLGLWVSPEFAEKATFTLQILAVFFFLNSSIQVAYWAAQGGGAARMTAFVLTLSAVLYGVGLVYFGELYSYNGVAYALFLGLLPFPMVFYWASKTIGFSMTEFFVTLLGTTLLGWLAVYAISWVNGFIGSDLLKILINMLIGGAVIMTVLWVFWNKKNASRTSEQTIPDEVAVAKA